jgi:hypothetical protein
MAKQQGHMLSSGSVNNLNYYRDKNGNYKFRTKSKLEGKRLLTDPAFQLTRQNMSEFSKAATAGKILRRELAINLGSTADGTVLTRLFSVLSKVIKSDPVSLRGERSAMKGNQTLLKGFEFNEKSPLSTVLFAKLNSTIDRVTGQSILEIPQIIPAKNISQAAGSTHCRIISVAVAVDFDSGEIQSATASTAIMPFTMVPVPPVNLVTQLEANSTKVLLQAVGVDYLMIVNGVEYPMQNKAFNSIGIVEVNPSV